MTNLALPWSFDRQQQLSPGDLQQRLQDNFDVLSLTTGSLAQYVPWVTVGSGGTAPAFENSWANYDAVNYQGARFYKDPLGRVHIEGLVKDGVVPATIFTLPAGYRPSKALLYSVIGNNAFARLDISGSGDVYANLGSNGFLSLNVSFKAGG